MESEHIARSRRILIAAGGTGGHIAPALAVGETVRALYGDKAVVRYVTGSKAIEREVFSAAEEFPDRICCNAAPKLSLGGISQFLLQGRSVLEAVKMLRKFRPHVVFATGGYVCVPLLLAARLMKIPYCLHESNAIPGRVVRLFARGAQMVFVAHEQAREELGGSNVRVAGTPIRRMMMDASRARALEYFGFSPGKPMLLVLGGSQGARAVNEALLDALPTLTEYVNEELQIVWACGPLNYNTVAQRLAQIDRTHLRIWLYDYLAEMHLAYRVADLVVSRAGASSIAEMTALGLPSVLIPYPHAKDNHQSANANSLQRIGAAEVIEETSLTGRNLARVVGDLLRSEGQRTQMARASRSAGAPGCAEAIAAVLMGNEVREPEQLFAFEAEREKATA